MVESDVRILLRFLVPFRRRLLALVGLTGVLAVLSMLPPLVMRAIVDQVLTEGRAHLLPALGLLLLALPIAVAVSHYFQNLGVAFVGQRFIFDLRQHLYRHMLGLSLRFYGRHSVGKLAHRIMGDSSNVQQILTTQTITVFSDIISAVFALVVAFLLHARLTFVLALTVGVFLANYRANIARIQKLTRAYRRSVDRVSGSIQNRLVGILAIKTFGTEEREHEQFGREFVESMDLVESSNLANDLFSLNASLIQRMGQAVLYFLGCALVLQGDMSYGDVLAFTAYALRLLTPVVHFSEIARQIQMVGISVHRLLEVLREKPEVADRPRAVRVVGLEGRVDFDHVDFSYEAGVPVLQGFDLHIASGETVALIGPTGCGKSTVLALLMRFYDVTAGAVRLDGRDVRSLRLQDVRNQFGVVLQDPMLFKISLTDNLRYGRPSADRRAIEAAARAAEIHEFIAGLPRGYDTVIGQDGVDLSLGQKQRITIARALLADPAILVMDEATSSLDSESERAIQQALERVLRGRTSLIVAHRLSTIRHADRIILMDRGRIVEMGTHARLMADANGRYRQLYLQHMGRGVITE